MKRIITAIFILSVITNSYAIETQFPGGSVPGSENETPEDVTTQPKQYYPPQQIIPNSPNSPNNNQQQ